MEKTKKRKRTAEGEDGANKRAIPKFSTIKVRHIPQEESALGPIVASTPGITAPEDITFTPYRKTVMSRSTGQRRQQVLLQSSQHGRLDYIAQEEQAGGPLGNLKHYVAVYDAEKGEFTVTGCHKVTLRSTLRPTQEEIEEAKAQQERQTYSSMRLALGQEFGTKKAKKVIADQTVNAINQRRVGETAPSVNAAEQAQLDQLNIKTENMLTKEEAQQEIDASKPRPVADLQASNKEDVYPIENLVSEDDLQIVQVADWQAAAKSGQNTKLSMRYVARRMNRVATMNKDATKLRLLKYMYIGLTWYTALEPNRGAKKVPHGDKLREKVDAPGSIFKSLQQQFTDRGYVELVFPELYTYAADRHRSNMSKWHIDKFILHICAMALHIDNFETNINDLQEDLRLTLAEMSKYFAELGCKIGGLNAAQRDQAKGRGEAGAARVARLIIPLEFPKQRVARARR
jgi:DNA-directed RNA polymerase I subunit RPA49